MEKFIKIENKTGVVYDTKIIDLDSGTELQDSVKSLTINPLIPGELITGSMDIYISQLDITNLRVIVNQASENMKLWGQACDKYHKNNSIWKRLFRSLAKRFLSL